jgi:hypothetical protein
MMSCMIYTWPQVEGIVESIYTQQLYIERADILCTSFLRPSSDSDSERVIHSISRNPWIEFKGKSCAFVS